jgi:alanine racemase
MESYLTAHISTSAIEHNVRLLRACLPPATKLCAVVKADCYGHGLTNLLGPLSRHADWLAVTNPEEALALRGLGYERPLLMFFSACANVEGNQLRDTLAELIAQDVTLTIVSPAEVAAVGQVARQVGSVADVHVKVDSGMGRSGVLPEHAPALLERARREPSIAVTGMYTHFATADEADKSYARRQLDTFLRTVDACGGHSGLCLHAANSAATIDLPETHLDMVRPGIAIYGYQPSDEMLRKLPLKPALRLTGRLMQVKTLPAGHKCGYGLTYTVPKDTLVGLVPVGYADGYPRGLSNRATMRIRGRDVPIRGRVAMDQVIIDLTGVPDAAIGDEMEIISNDPANPHSAENLARLCNTITYEIITRLGNRARRVLED